MKALARCYIWWPNVDSAIEDVVKHCQVCQQSRPSPPVALLHPWEWPSQPGPDYTWTLRVHFLDTIT